MYDDDECAARYVVMALLITPPTKTWSDDMARVLPAQVMSMKGLLKIIHTNLNFDMQIHVLFKTSLHAYTFVYHNLLSKLL